MVLHIDMQHTSRVIGQSVCQGIERLLCLWDVYGHKVEAILMEPHLHVCMDILVQHDPNKPGGVAMWIDG